MTETVNSDEREGTDRLALVAYVTGSTYREEILLELRDGASQPSELADTAEIARPHASRALSELAEKDLVQSHSTDSRAKLYTLTDCGATVAEQISANRQ